jgi:hypothetical protein
MTEMVDFAKIPAADFVSEIRLDDGLFIALERFVEDVSDEYERRSKKPSLHRRGDLLQDGIELESLLNFFEAIRNKDSSIKAYPPDLYEAKSLQKRRAKSGVFEFDFFKDKNFWLFLEARRVAR